MKIALVTKINKDHCPIVICVEFVITIKHSILRTFWKIKKSNENAKEIIFLFQPIFWQKIQ